MSNNSLQIASPNLIETPQIQQLKAEMRGDYLRLNESGAITLIINLILTHGVADNLGRVWVFSRDGLSIDIRLHNDGHLEGYVTTANNLRVQVISDLVPGEERFIQGRWVELMRLEHEQQILEKESADRLRERVEIIRLTKEKEADI